MANSSARLSMSSSGRAALLVILVLAALALLAGRALAQEAAVGGDALPLDTLLQRVKQAYGDASQVERGVVVRQTGTTMSLMHGGEPAVMERTFAWPDRLHVVIRYSEVMAEERLLIGDEAWKDGEAASGPMQMAMRLQLARISLPMLLHWVPVEDLGRLKGGDGELWRIVRVPLGDGLSVQVQIDEESGRILRSMGEMAMGGATMQFASAYSGFREDSTGLLPGREDQYAMGRYTGYTVIESVDVLADFPIDPPGR